MHLIGYVDVPQGVKYIHTYSNIYILIVGNNKDISATIYVYGKYNLEA